jgi:hypothetical protein
MMHQIISLEEEQVRLVSCLEDLYEKLWVQRVSYQSSIQDLEDNIYYTLQRLKLVNRKINETQELLRESCNPNFTESGTV